MRVHVFIDRDGVPTKNPCFSKPEVTLGRRPSNDVVLSDAGASGSHARVFVTGGALTIVDLRSTNGTYVNRRRLQGPHVLSADDIVEIGDTRLRFSLSGVETTGPERPVAHTGFVDEPDPPSMAPVDDGVPDFPPDGADWPAPPPLMDDVMLDSGQVHLEPAAESPAEAPSRSAVFPRFSAAPPDPPSAPPSPPPPPSPRPVRAVSGGPGLEGAFEFEAAEPKVLVNRVFEAVWRRVSRLVLAHEDGARAQAEAALRSALNAADSVRPLGELASLRDRMLAELVDDGPVVQLLEGDPDEVVIVSSARARVSRNGHVSAGKTDFTCPAAVCAWVQRITGVRLGPSTASARGVFGNYAIHAAYAPDGTIVSLRRRVGMGEASADALVRAGVASASMLTLMSTCVAARSTVVIAAGPGARATTLMAALLGEASSQDLHVAFVSPGADVGAFSPSTVVMVRSGSGGHSLEAALGLSPDRIAIEDVDWAEAGAVASVVSRAFGQLVGVRSASAMGALHLLRSMLARSTGPDAADVFVHQSVALVATVQHFADGMDRITQVAEPALDDEGRLVSRDIFTLVPGSRTWEFSGTKPNCVDSLAQRGFPLDPSILA